MKEIIYAVTILEYSHLSIYKLRGVTLDFGMISL